MKTQKKRKYEQMNEKRKKKERKANNKTNERKNAIVRLIDFNSISNCLRLYHTLRFENHIHCAFIFIFFVLLSYKTFLSIVFANTNNF